MLDKIHNLFTLNSFPLLSVQHAGNGSLEIRGNIFKAIHQSYHNSLLMSQQFVGNLE